MTAPVVGTLIAGKYRVERVLGQGGMGIVIAAWHLRLEQRVAIKILRSVHAEHGTLDGLRVLKLLGCVNSTGDFIEQHLVINGASDLLHQIFGKDGDGYHARSALGFASIPTGSAVEIEAIFEIKQ